MQRFAIVALLVAGACQATKTELPEGQADTRVHEEYAEFRPVTIAVLPVKAPSTGLRGEVRREVYRRLFDMKYSPFTFAAVDANIDSDGEWDPGASLDWDATLAVDISEWRAVKGTQHFAADGTATLRHKTGEILWSCKFEQHTFEVPARGGVLDEKKAARDIARFLVSDSERFPERPPLPRE